MITLAALAGLGFILDNHEMPSVTLPDGTVVTYHGSSKGLPLPPAPNDAPWQEPFYRHTAPAKGQRLKRLWPKMRGSLPGWLVSRLPAWDYHDDDYPDEPTENELELRFRVTGALVNHPWDIFVADENGWETCVDRYICGDDGRFEHGAPQHSGWLRLGSAYPRHCKSLRIRFRTRAIRHLELSPEQRAATFSEMVIANPFYEGLATAKGSALPLTQPFRDGTFTLEEIHRDSVLGDYYGAFTAIFYLQHHGRPWGGFSVGNFDVTDSSDQRFGSTSGSSEHNKGCYRVSTGLAPWSDDPCWKLRFELCRCQYGSEAEDHEIFRFVKLPAPTDKSVELNREFTRHGVTLRLTTLTALQDGSARVRIEGWNQKDPRHRLIIHDARDDQGRTKAAAQGRGSIPIVWGPVDGDRNGGAFAVQLPPDAKSWNLSLFMDTMSEVEFTVQPPPVK